MPTDVLERAIDHVQAWAAVCGGAAAADADLLDRFLSNRDEAAFAALVHRHGPLVYGVCRRMLGDRHDAEDALQATFLVLAQKARSVRKAGPLASWLHGVAVRVALNLRRARSRRQQREAASARPEPTHDDLTWPEVQAALDEELQRLPERQRAPLVLRYLEGKSRDEAATLLGWSLGALHGRLERARQTLAARLAARGLTLSAGLAAALAPAERVGAATIVALSRAALDHGVSLSPGVVALAAQASRSAVPRLVSIGAVLGIGMAAAALLWFTTTTPPPSAQAQPAPAQAQDKTKQASIVVAAVLRENDQLAGMILAVDPDTGAWRKIVDADAREPRVSPDGQTVVYAGERSIFNCDVAGSNDPGKLFDFVPYAAMAWTPDGKHLIGSRINGALGSEIWQHETWRYDASGRNPEKLKLPPAEAVLDISPDGQWALTRARWVTRLNTSDLKVMKLDGSDARRLSDVGGFNEPGRFAPDGKRVAWCRRDKNDEAVWISNTDGTGKKRVFGAKGVHLSSVCWSPDGRTLAIVARDYAAGPDGRVNRIPFGPEGNCRIELVSAADGAKRTMPLKGQVWSLREPDWRAAPAPDDKDETRETTAQAIAFLKSAQRDGHWETGTDPRGGHTSLATWALLQAGVKPDDKHVAAGLAFLRGLEPTGTYVRSLQTAALARAGRAADRKLLERNVAWLIEGMVRDDAGRCAGWSYTAKAPRGDNSNSQFAVLALAAAAEAGIAIERRTWEQIREYYLRTQAADGGWGYITNPPQTTLSMTGAGLAGLVISERRLDPPPPAAIERGWQRLGELWHATPDTARPSFYALHALARAGRLTNQRELKAGERTVDWFAEGARRFKETQQPDGSWRSPSALENHPVVATSFALLFLANRK